MKTKKLDRLKDKDFRDAFVGAHIDQGLAFQIKSLRDDRGWTQGDLANRLGLKSQSSIARYEDPSYGKLSISKIKELGAVFDVGILVKFVPYSRFLGEVEDLSPSTLAAKSFESELPLLEEDCEVIGYYSPGRAMEKFISSRSSSDEFCASSFDSFSTEVESAVCKFSEKSEKDYGDYEECDY